MLKHMLPAASCHTVLAAAQTMQPADMKEHCLTKILPHSEKKRAELPELACRKTT